MLQSWTVHPNTSRRPVLERAACKLDTMVQCAHCSTAQTPESLAHLSLGTLSQEKETLCALFKCLQRYACPVVLPSSVFTSEVHASLDLCSKCGVPLMLRHARSKFCVITAACSMLLQFHCRVKDSNDVHISHRHTSWRRGASGVYAQQPAP